MFRVQGLRARYLTRRALALDDVSFTIAAGERVLLAGPSGSGKSTLGLCLAGLIPLSEDADLHGEIEIDGRATVAFAPGDLAEYVVYARPALLAAGACCAPDQQCDDEQDGYAGPDQDPPALACACRSPGRPG